MLNTTWNGSALNALTARLQSMMVSAGAGVSLVPAGGTGTVITPGRSSSTTLTIVPANGFTGTVNLSCTVSGPTGAIDLPQCGVPRFRNDFGARRSKRYGLNHHDGNNGEERSWQMVTRGQRSGRGRLPYSARECAALAPELIVAAGDRGDSVCVAGLRREQWHGNNNALIAEHDRRQLRGDRDSERYRDQLGQRADSVYSAVRPPRSGCPHCMCEID